MKVEATNLKILKKFDDTDGNKKNKKRNSKKP